MRYGAVAVVAAVMAGCGNDGDAVDFHGDGATVVESPVPNAADLAVPAPDTSGKTAEARVSRPTPPPSLAQRTRGAALEFAQYAVDVLNHAQATGDVEPLQHISFWACRGCNGRIDDLRLVYGQGGFVHGGAWSVLSSSALSEGRESWRASLTVHASRQRLKRSAESQVEFVAGGRHRVDMSVARTDAGWLITRLTVA